MSLSSHAGQDTFTIAGKTVNKRAGTSNIYDIYDISGDSGGGRTKALISIEDLMQGKSWNSYAYGTVDVPARINSVPDVTGTQHNSYNYKWQFPGDGSFVYDPTDLWIIHSRVITNYSSTYGPFDDEKKMWYMKDVADMSPRGDDNGQIQSASFQTDHYITWIAAKVFARRRGHKLDLGDIGGTAPGYSHMSSSSYLEIRGA